ncbi:MAG: ABC transporter substrate-binding protein [bacterium]|nr:ABC transporter substrate-binding protein [bacterium]
MRKSLVILIVLSLVSTVFLSFNSISFAQKKYNESPMLTELVKQGKLAPIEQRLPKKPFVVGPGVLLPKDDLDFEIGKYGGTMRLIHHMPDLELNAFIMNNEPLVSCPGITGTNIQGNIVESYKVSSDWKTFTFKLREGLRWSDGTPVTTEDVQFTYEDFLLNETLTPVFPTYLRSGNRPDGKPMKLDILDKYTFRITFDEPYGGFLVQLAINNWRSYTDLLKPKHYLKQFHIKYTPVEKLEPLLKEQKLSKEEWNKLFHLKDCTIWEMAQKDAVSMPYLTPWIPTQITTQYKTFERNPYYFKVDTAGNQLPYIDKLTSTLVQDPELANLRIIAGEADHSYEYAVFKNMPLYLQNAEKGNYRVILYGLHRTTADPVLNLTYPDPTWRKVVRDVRFRRALNMAINRKELIETVYYGYASPPTSVPSEYDPKKAEQILDSIGLNKRDAEGWRLGPDGKRFTIEIEFFIHFEEQKMTAELVAEYWKKIGIYTTIKVIEPGLFYQRLDANELKATMYMWTHDKNLWWAIWTPGANYWGPLWHIWMTTKGKSGEEPPAEVKKYYDTIAKLYLVPPQERAKLRTDFIRSIYNNIWWFITVEDLKYPVVVSKDLGNVAKKGYGIAAQFAGEIYFFKK